MKVLLIIGALNGALAITLGAFGAHGLKSRLDAAMLGTWSTASEYHFLHAIALLLIGILAKQYRNGDNVSVEFIVAGWMMFAGMLVFSGSLYTLVLSGHRWLGAVTPLGGITLIMAWLLLAWALYKHIEL